jgi:hypothetical protein
MNQRDGSGPKAATERERGAFSGKSALQRHAVVALMAIVVALQSRSAAQTKISDYQVKAPIFLTSRNWRNGRSKTCRMDPCPL